MSRLSIETPGRAQTVLNGLNRDMERRLDASQPGLCPVDMSLNFLRLCHAQTCGKCVPCRVGLSQLAVLIERVLDRTATLEDIDLIENTAQVIADSADCAIGYEAAHMVLKGVRGFREDYEEHILHGRCICGLSHPVPCVSTCPAHVDIPGYVALIHEGRYQDAVRLIRKDNPFVSACAYVCGHPCEGQCRRRMVDDAINICGLKRFAVDNSKPMAVDRKAEPTVIRAVAAGKVAAANIDNKQVAVPEGTTILAAAQSAGIKIPHLCYLKDINEIAACRVCCVEVEGERAMVTACNSPVKDGMVVRTNSPRTRATRRTNVELILSQHDCKCAACVRSGNCQLQAIANDLGILNVPYETQLPRGRPAGAGRHGPGLCRSGRPGEDHRGPGGSGGAHRLGGVLRPEP